MASENPLGDANRLAYFDLSCFILGNKGINKSLCFTNT